MWSTPSKTIKLSKAPDSKVFIVSLGPYTINPVS